jgi:hypothetical protein
MSQLDADPITPDEAQEMRRILEKFYGKQVLGWPITHRHYVLLGTIVDESKRCTKAMHLVPRPYDLKAPINWIRKQVRDLFRRALLAEESEVYLTCLRVAANNFRTEFQEAAMGL